MKDKLNRIIHIVLKFLIRTSIAYVAAWYTSLWSIPAAYSERGYEAAGGEWVLIVFTFLFAFWFIGWFAGFMKLRKEDKTYAAKAPPLSPGSQDAGSR